MIKGRKGEYTSLLTKLRDKGFARVIFDGNTYHLDDIDDLKVDSNVKHSIDLIVDRLTYKMLIDEKRV